MGVHDQVTKIIGTTGIVASVTTRGTKGAVATENLDANGNLVDFATNSTIQGLGGLVGVAYDYVSLSYSGVANNLTSVVFKTGGSSGTTVATLTLAYNSSNNLTSVTKT